MQFDRPKVGKHRRHQLLAPRKLHMAAAIKATKTNVIKSHNAKACDCRLFVPFALQKLSLLDSAYNMRLLPYYRPNERPRAKPPIPP